MKFESLGLHPDILKGISDAGFEHCTPIQEQSLPKCLEGQDVIAQSQTGTGKTAVFLLTIFNRVMASGAASSGQPKALVMVPTRELCTQIIDDAMKLGKHLPFRSVAVYGGVEYGKQVNALKGGVDLVVATPGRMIDLYKSKTLSLDSIEIFVIDEADRMFDMGFAPDIMYIAGRLPKKQPRQTMLFSATIDANVRRLASRYMNPDPVMIEIEPEQLTVSAIDQKIIYVSNEEKLPVLITLLKRPEVERAIIFTNMKSTAEKVGWKLAANGLAAKVLTGDVTQERRQKIIDGMKFGKVDILVATDVAARGLHIEAVTHVINYDLPDDAANYVHRIGRTARAGKSGRAYSLVCEDHVLNLPEIEKYIERKLENEWIEDSELVKDIVQSERPRREKGFEKRDGKKPDPSRRRERTFSKDNRKGPRPHPERKGGPAAPAAEGMEGRKEGGPPAHAAEKREGRKEGGPAAHAAEKREGRKEGGPAAHAAERREGRKEGGPAAPAGERREGRKEGGPPAHAAEKREGRKEGGPGPHKKGRFEDRKRSSQGPRPIRHRTEGQAEKRDYKAKEAFAPAVSARPEKKTHAHAADKGQTGHEEKKGGLLKRIFRKLIKKS